MSDLIDMNVNNLFVIKTEKKMRVGKQSNAIDRLRQEINENEKLVDENVQTTNTQKTRLLGNG
jgi:hypothetical protein